MNLRLEIIYDFTKIANPVANLQTYFSNKVPEQKGAERIFYGLTILDFSKNTNILTIEINAYTLKHNIAGYKQINHQKYPVFSPICSVKSKNVYFLNRTIDIKTFCQYQLLKQELPAEINLRICKMLDYEPTWASKQREILNRYARSKELDAIAYKKFLPIAFNPRREDFKTIPSKLWPRIVLAPFTLGLSFIGFISKNKAKHNASLNETNKQYNKEENARINKLNYENKQKIDDFNKSLDKEKTENYTAIINLENELYHSNDLEKVTSQWQNLRYNLPVYDGSLNHKKGIYIIQNSTKNKYYVGQSKNIGKRIFSQHFQTASNSAKNPLFVNDWNNGDEFLYQIIVYGDKGTNLDDLEKQYIEKYDSFRNGYNRTGGND